MSDKNDGGPAFPINHPHCPDPSTGMTLRQWYAGMAMQGVIASGTVTGNDFNETSKEVSGFAFGVADAMIKEGSHE